MSLVKICGLKTSEAVEAAIDAGADFIGLVHFPKSPRHVSLEEAAELANRARGRIKTVVLLVNPERALLGEVRRTLTPDFIQLHGNESIDQVKQIRARSGLPVIKAIKVKNGQDIEMGTSYRGIADMLLFDAKPPKAAILPGGNGIPFDWSLLTGFNTDEPYMLSGGLDPQSVAEAIKITGAPIVDVSSGVESAPGIKDVDMIRQFIEQAHK